MSPLPYINFTHHANAPILAHLHIESPESAQANSPDLFQRAYKNAESL